VRGNYVAKTHFWRHNPLLSELRCEVAADRVGVIQLARSADRRNVLSPMAKTSGNCVREEEFGSGVAFFRMLA
jgi:hypothetical protein